MDPKDYDHILRYLESLLKELVKKDYNDPKGPKDPIKILFCPQEDK
jgi:hypothetical protein